MDKYEYKVRADEIKALISEGEFAEAVSIADTIDWRRVKSVMMLCTISDLYKINRRYQESKDILLLAYEKHPTGRLIVYSLCELSIKLEEYVQAIEYYKEFSHIAPKDTGRYILQYRLYEAQDVSLEERIAVLEEFKKRDYREKWAYELAYLYHRIGLATKCVEECDEMFLWFGDGKYVIKALELKALHGPLSEEQQAKYEAWIRERDGVEQPEEDSDEDDVSGDTPVAGQIGHTEEDDSDIQQMTPAPTMELPEVKTVDLGQYNTINLQMALAESMKEILEEEAPQGTSEQGVEEVSESVENETFPEDVEEIPESEEDESYPEDAEEVLESEEDEVYPEDAEEVLESEEDESYSEDVEEVLESEEDEVYPEDAEEALESEEDEVYPEDIEEVSESVKDIEDVAQEIGDSEEAERDLEEDTEEEDSVVASLIAPLLEETIKMPSPEEVEEQLQAASVIQFPERQQSEPPIEADEEQSEPEQEELQREEAEQTEPEGEADKVISFDAQQIVEQLKQEAQEAVTASGVQQAAEVRDDVLTPLNAKPSKYDSFLSQEYDGQISLVMPDAVRVEKQITGQLSIDDIMAEWEEMKRTSEQRRKEEVRQRILAHTGNLFADFDEATKNGLLEELERAFMAAIMKESERNPVIKKVISPENDAEIKSAPSVTKSDTEQPVANAEPIEDLPEDDIEDEVEELEEIEESAAEESLTTESDVDEEIVDTAEEPEETVPEEKVTETMDEGVEESVQSNVQDRELTAEEQELFGQFTHHRKTRRQLVHTLDNMSLASYTGNVIITGEEETATLELAKALIKEMQLNDNNFSEKVAKISANVLNKKDVAETFARLNNGALIIEKASRLKPTTVSKMTKVLEKDNMGLLLIIIDKKQSINQLFADYAELNNNFNLRIDIEPLNDEALVAYAKQYAEELEYSIDEFGILALHTRIADRQTSDHEVSMAEVRELVDEAIYYANKKTPKHFMDILLAKRYDEDDMIILREKDFMHY